MNPGARIAPARVQVVGGGSGYRLSLGVRWSECVRKPPMGNHSSHSAAPGLLRLVGALDRDVLASLGTSSAPSALFSDLPGNVPANNRTRSSAGCFDSLDQLPDGASLSDQMTWIGAVNLDGRMGTTPGRDPSLRNTTSPKNGMHACRRGILLTLLEDTEYRATEIRQLHSGMRRFNAIFVASKGHMCRPATPSRCARSALAIMRWVGKQPSLTHGPTQPSRVRSSGNETGTGDVRPRHLVHLHLKPRPSSPHASGSHHQGGAPGASRHSQRLRVPPTGFNPQQVEPTCTFPMRFKECRAGS